MRLIQAQTAMSAMKAESRVVTGVVGPKIMDTLKPTSVRTPVAHWAFGSHAEVVWVSAECAVGVAVSVLCLCITSLSSTILVINISVAVTTASTVIRGVMN